MNNRTAIALILAGLTGCSTQHTVQPPKETSIDLPLLAPSPEPEMRGRICQLGTSCLAMDPRPFEPCLLSTKHCSDKGVEPLLVAPAPSIVPAPRIVSR